MGTRSDSASEMAIASAFVSARQQSRALVAYPGEQPADLATAYRIQDAAIALAGRPVGGWKVGRINPPLGAVDRLSGPIFADQIIPARPMPTMPMFQDGFGAAEAEFLLRIGTAPEPGKSSFSRDEVIPLIDAIHVGIEIASSPFPGINDSGPAVTVSDFGNNHGLIVGAGISLDLLTAPVELRVNDMRVGAGSAEGMLDGPFGAARFLFENLASRGIVPQPGQWISTGAVTGVHRVHPDDRVEARFGETLSVHCHITAC